MTEDTDKNDRGELIEAARRAVEPADNVWDQIADYFDDQRAQVKPRDVRQDRR
jgi:hypothetical protein